MRKHLLILTIILFILIFIFTLLPRKRSEDKIVISPAENPKSNVSVKQPVIGFGKKATQRVKVIIPKTERAIKSETIEVRGEKFEVLLPEKKSLSVIIYRKPLITFAFNLGIGLEFFPARNPYLRLSFIDVKTIDGFTFLSRDGWGLGIGQRFFGRIYLDGLWYILGQREWGIGVGIKSIF